MKSISEQLSTLREAAVASGKITVQEITETVSQQLKAKGVADPTEEVVLAATKQFCESRGFRGNESRRTIRRNNGSGVVTEVSNAEKIAEFSRDNNVSMREASVILFGTDTGANTTVPKEVVESLAARWAEYCPTLTDSECRTLAEKNIEP